MTISLASAAPVWAADAKTMTIGVTSFADTLEPTEQYFSWVIFPLWMLARDLQKFDGRRKYGSMSRQSGPTVRMVRPGLLRFEKVLNFQMEMI